MEDWSWNIPIILWNSYQKGEYTDLEISFKGVAHKVHRVVVCNQSNIFRILCDGTENGSVVISLDNNPDIDAAQLKCLLHYLYRGFYCSFDTPKASTTTSIPPRANSVVSTNAHYWRSRDSPHCCESVLADQKHLKSKEQPFIGVPKKGYRRSIPPPTSTTTTATAPKKKSVSIDPYGNTLSPKFHAQMYAAAEKYGIESLCIYSKRMYVEEIGVCSFEEFLGSVGVIYKTTPEQDRQLRDVAAAYMAKYIRNMKDTKLVKDVVKIAPDFAGDVFGIMMDSEEERDT